MYVPYHPTWPPKGSLCTYPIALVYGPKWYAGLDIPNPFTEQLVTQLVLMQQYSSDSNVTTRSMHQWMPSGWKQASMVKSLTCDWSFRGL